MLYSCDRCDSPATVHQTDIKGGQKVERHFCEECARALHVPQPAKELAKLLKSFEPGVNDPRRKRDDVARQCPDCGMTYAEFRKQGRFGCPRDYEIFGADVERLLKRIHGDTTYTGMTPDGDEVRDGVVIDEVTRIRARLDEAIHAENYEEAARLRDQIRRLSGSAPELPEVDDEALRESGTKGPGESEAG